MAACMRSRRDAALAAERAVGDVHRLVLIALDGARFDERDEVAGGFGFHFGNLFAISASAAASFAANALGNPSSIVCTWASATLADIDPDFAASTML